VKEKRAVGWVTWPRRQQFISKTKRRGPQGSLSGSVTLSIAPPGKLAGWGFTALIDHTTHRVGKTIILNPVNYYGANCKHASLTFASRFPVHRERNTMLRLCIYLANVSDRMFVGTIAFAIITKWRRN
jgi:hypothetical protein